MMSSKTSQITFRGIVRSVGIIILVVLIGVYIQFQARNFIQGPSISLWGEYAVVQHDRELVLEGAVENIVKLTLNGKEIYTDEQGNFSQKVFLEKGYTVVTLYAEDRFGRSVSVEREYVYVDNE